MLRAIYAEYRHLERGRVLHAGPRERRVYQGQDEFALALGPTIGYLNNQVGDVDSGPHLAGGALIRMMYLHGIEQLDNERVLFSGVQLDLQRGGDNTLISINPTFGTVTGAGLDPHRGTYRGLGPVLTFDVSTRKARALFGVQITPSAGLSGLGDWSGF